MITINFASKDYRLITRIRAGLLAACALLFFVMGAMLWTHASLRTDLSAVEKRLAEAGAEDARLQPLLAERGQLVRDLTAMSGLMEARKILWTRLLSGIESVMPKGVALTRVEYSAKEGAVHLDGVALSPEALRNLILGLEKSPSFRNPFLKHQSLEKGSISFNVVAVYHEVKTPAVVSDKR